MPRRFASRTTILRRTFDWLLFNGRTLGSLRQSGPQLVVIAAELRTESAFYFGRREAGSWAFRKRDGALVTDRVTLTDGGVYENLGLSPLWPDRSRDVSVAVEDVEIASRVVWKWPGWVRLRRVDVGSGRSRLNNE